jgi:hypothetical protein
MSEHKELPDNLASAFSDIDIKRYVKLIGNKPHYDFIGISKVVASNLQKEISDIIEKQKKVSILDFIHIAENFRIIKLNLNFQKKFETFLDHADKCFYDLNKAVSNNTIEDEDDIEEAFNMVVSQLSDEFGIIYNDYIINRKLHVIQRVLNKMGW